MIRYNYMSERWEDDRDEKFLVNMTPEGDPEELKQEFQTQEEFYKWYYRGSKQN